jgi:type IV secretory pathway TraG/TraD family ATPase VirD4
VLQVFGVNDHDSARLVSDLLGQETVVFQTMARALDRGLLPDGAKSYAKLFSATCTPL